MPGNAKPDNANPVNFTAAAEELLQLCIAIQQIPAPTGNEAQRARWVADYLRQGGFAEVQMDALDNVYARVAGARRGPALLVSAHTDTVFPAETNLSITREPSSARVFGPGLGDNSTGVAALLWLGQQLRQRPPAVDVWLVANTGEEGNGDLRGMRGAVDRLAGQIGACIVIEGMGLSRVVHRGLGSRRFRIEVTAPGGHSWSDFGAASAVHVLVQLAADLTRLKAPAHPRTTFNIGVIGGGRSINTIAQQSSLELDLRSEDPAALNAIVAQANAIVDRYTTPRWQQAGVAVRRTLIGDRPAGEIADDHALVLAAFGSLAAIGIQPQPHTRTSSTDANIPLSRGLPAVCIGVTDGGNAHRLDEWILPDLLPRGLRHLLTLTGWATEWLTRNDR
jgi:acetylornithine deacetylase/succinyl-diaminopimelate desuccinylase-like protein